MLVPIPTICRRILLRFTGNLIRGNLNTKKWPDDDPPTIRYAELREKLGELQLEKDKEKENECRAPHNHSYDSALGTDLSDAETETIEVELQPAGSGLYDAGFTLAGGKSRPVYSNDPGLYVVSVARGGPADGKLKINDCLIKVCQSSNNQSLAILIT